MTGINKIIVKATDFPDFDMPGNCTLVADPSKGLALLFKKQIYK